MWQELAQQEIHLQKLEGVPSKIPNYAHLEENGMFNLTQSDEEDEEEKESTTDSCGERPPNRMTESIGKNQK